MDNMLATSDGNAVKNISEALEENLSHLDPDEHISTIIKKFNLPEEIATDIVNARTMIDKLSEIILDSNIGTEPIRYAISENLGSYLKRSYRIFEEKGFVPTPSAKNNAEELFMDRWLANKYNINLDEFPDGLNWEDLGLTSKQILEGATYGKREVDKILKIGDEKNFDKFLGHVMQYNTALMRGRKDIHPVLQDLLGKIESPPLNIIQTVNKLIQIVESNKYYSNVLELGGSVPSNKELYAEALDAARYKSKHIDLADGEELTAVTTRIKDGEFVNIRSEVTGDFTVGKVTGSTQKGYKIEIKDFKTQETSEQFIPFERIKKV